MRVVQGRWSNEGRVEDRTEGVVDADFLRRAVRGREIGGQGQ